MDKSALKKFATNARVELLEKVELQARKIGITSDTIKEAEIESSDAVYIDGRRLSNIERDQRNRLIGRIEEIGFERVMEETAYTWFNRFIALRYMEVNDYLPTRVRVLSSERGSAEPDMMREALSLDLELDKERVYEYKINNQTDQLFKYLIKIHCNDLNRYMPFMFETIENYTEILFPEGLLATDSFLRQMTDTDFIPEDNWQKVEIVGWLYQYYISDENERVIRAKKRYKAEELPYATQLFTPEWIVRYMVQNTLGRYWTESHPEDRDLIDDWEFYLKDQQKDYQEKIALYINNELQVEEIKCFDPAMGSGHILVYMFDVLYEIYSKNGYTEREIPKLIIEKNLYGLDIDDRAYQLSCFSVVMKALEYNRHFLRSIEHDGLAMNLASIQETNSLADEEIAYLAGETSGEQFNKMKDFINQFQHAKSIGSLIKIEHHDRKFLQQRLSHIEEHEGNLFELELKDRTLNLFKNLIKQTELMDSKYDVFITNPPYVGNKYLPPEVSTYLKENYNDGKSDLFSSFIVYSFDITKEYGQIGFMSPYVWMFLSSHEKLRHKIINKTTISSLIQLEYSGFEGATVPICTFTLRNYNSDLKGEYIRLSDFSGVKNQPLKTLEAVQNPLVSYRYSFHQEKFQNIPGNPIAYWATNKVREIYSQEKKLHEIAEPKTGIQTGKNQEFLRYWYEVSLIKIGFQMTDFSDIKKYNYKWYPYNKGGEFRKWYGNNEYIINMENEGEAIKNFSKTSNFRLREPRLYFKESITWSFVSSSNFSVRYSPTGFLFDVAGSSVFPQEGNIYYLTAYLCSKIAFELLKFQNPTLNFQVENISNLPVIEDIKTRIKRLIENLVIKNIELSKDDWDSYETSWDFKLNPIIENSTNLISESFEIYKKETNLKYNHLKKNEEEINRLLIEIYNLENELTPHIEDKDVTVTKILDSKESFYKEIKGNIYVLTKEEIMEQFISYAIGCMLGRYSLDEEGLIFAGGEFNSSQYKIFTVDEENVLPILSGTYFEDDIVTRFVDFVRITFSDETLEENLIFIADAIGRRKNETARETLRRYFLNDFYKNLVQMYKKKPIYWLFTSGKEKAFNCLIYMHRYDKTTLSRIRTDYLHPVQTRMDSEKNDLLSIINGDSTPKEINQAKKELKSLDRKIDELIKYDELLHHKADQQIEIDLDDGVKVNYEKFKGLVAKM